jgi:hypothetical protein
VPVAAAVAALQPLDGIVTASSISGAQVRDALLGLVGDEPRWAAAEQQEEQEERQEQEEQQAGAGLEAAVQRLETAAARSSQLLSSLAGRPKLLPSRFGTGATNISPTGSASTSPRQRAGASAAAGSSASTWRPSGTPAVAQLQAGRAAGRAPGPPASKLARQPMPNISLMAPPASSSAAPAAGTSPRRAASSTAVNIKPAAAHTRPPRNPGSPGTGAGSYAAASLLGRPDAAKPAGAQLLPPGSRLAPDVQRPALPAAAAASSGGGGRHPPRTRSPVQPLAEPELRALLARSRQAVLSSREGPLALQLGREALRASINSLSSGIAAP